jgi:hypothetical protein
MVIIAAAIVHTGIPGLAYTSSNSGWRKAKERWGEDLREALP